jgi:hypothetical protein
MEVIRSSCQWHYHVHMACQNVKCDSVRLLINTDNWIGVIDSIFIYIELSNMSVSLPLAAVETHSFRKLPSFPDRNFQELLYFLRSFLNSLWCSILQKHPPSFNLTLSFSSLHKQEWDALVFSPFGSLYHYTLLQMLSRAQELRYSEVCSSKIFSTNSSSSLAFPRVWWDDESTSSRERKKEKHTESTYTRSHHIHGTWIDSPP